MNTQPSDRPQPPATPPDPDTLPHPVTFFLTARQRRAVLRRLRAKHPDRATALLRALAVDTRAEDRP